MLKNEHLKETEFYYMAKFRVSPDTKVFQRFLNLGGVFSKRPVSSLSFESKF